jgi:group I intron endonuclease
MIGIYKVQSPSGKIYIGQSIDIEHRFREYKRIYNCENQTRLLNSLKKYGPQYHTFEIIEVCDKKVLNKRERYYQDYYDVLSENGLNCKLTTTKDKSGKNSIESNIKRSKSMMGKNKGKRPDVSERNKKVHTGKTITEEHRIAISKKLKGKPHSYQGERGVTQRKPVLQFSKDKSKLIREYESLQEAARNVGRRAGDIHRVVSGKGSSCAGFYWEYKKMDYGEV